MRRPFSRNLASFSLLNKRVISNFHNNQAYHTNFPKIIKSTSSSPRATSLSNFNPFKSKGIISSSSSSPSCSYYTSRSSLYTNNQTGTGESHHLQIRNVAIIAHVDHGKTSMVDNLLVQTGALALHDKEGDRVMDSNALEKERGITILAKHTSFDYRNHRINLVDTPGHGDFGGEVENVLGMVDGVILIVDACEGPMPQTKYVLSKALKKGLNPIVLLNKMDKPARREQDVETEIFDLFVSLQASDKQLAYPTLFGSAKEGWVVRDLAADDRTSVLPLLDAVIAHVPPPAVIANTPFQMLITHINSDPHLGRMLTGKIVSGSVAAGHMIKVLDPAGSVIHPAAKVVKVVAQHGIREIALDEGRAGDIVGILGAFPDAFVTHTACEPSIAAPLPADPLDPPVLSICFGPNTSPIAGREGTLVTASAIEKRLKKELESNVTLQVNTTNKEGVFEVKGRGTLQLSILAENMRREGFELSLSPPKVLFSEDESGMVLEPIEEVTIETEMALSRIVMTKVSQRLGIVKSSTPLGSGTGKIRNVFLIPARTLFGLRPELMLIARGDMNFTQAFHGYLRQDELPVDDSGGVPKRAAMVSMAQGKATAYALEGLEPRGVLFVGPGDTVYEGMIIGECAKEYELNVNPVKAKHVSNVRTVLKDEFVRLNPPRKMTLEEAIGYLQDDELIELTPITLRLRKAVLSQATREKLYRQQKRDKENMKPRKQED